MSRHCFNVPFVFFYDRNRDSNLRVYVSRFAVCPDDADLHIESFHRKIQTEQQHSRFINPNDDAQYNGYQVKPPQSQPRE